MRAGCVLALLLASSAAGARPLVVMPPWSGLAVLLFPEELEAVRGAVTDFIASHKELDFAIVPRDRLAPIERRAHEGRLRDGGPVCAHPPTLDDAIERELPGALRAWSNLDCGEHGCALEVIVHAWSPNEHDQWIWSAPVDGEGVPRAWMRAVAHLKPVPHTGPAGFTYRGGVAPPTVRAVLLRAIGGWRAPPDKLFAPAQKALDACHDASKRHHNHYYVTMLQVRQDGTIARSQVTHEADEPAEACVTAALAPLDFERGPAARRLHVAVVDEGLPIALADARQGVAGEIFKLKTNAAYALADHLPFAELRGCYADGGLIEARRYDVGLEIEASGHVATTRVEAPAGRDVEVRACLERALLASRFPCAADGKPVTARFVLALDPYPLPPEEKSDKAE